MTTRVDSAIHLPKSVHTCTCILVTGFTLQRTEHFRFPGSRTNKGRGKGRQGEGTGEREVWGGRGLNISGFQEHKSRKGIWGKAKGLGKGGVGWVGIEHFRFPGPQIKERQIGQGKGTGEREVWGGWGLTISGFQDHKSRKGKLGKPKGLGKGKCGVGGD